MSTIITRKVNGSGPYAYRVEWNRQQQDHDWEYLGPTGKVDPEDLTRDETAQLRAEGFGLARRRATAEADLFKRDLANEFRDEMADRFPDKDLFAPTDDRRSSKVELAEDAPESVEVLLGERYSDIRSDINDSAGQALLTEDERDKIDFTKDNMDTFTARRAKAAILDEGIPESSWLDDVWSEDLTTEGEAREAAQNNRESIVGERTDENEGDTSNTSNAEFRDKQSKQALAYAKEADDEKAREYLLNQAGWTEEEIENTPVPPNIEVNA